MPAEVGPVAAGERVAVEVQRADEVTLVPAPGCPRAPAEPARSMALTLTCTGPGKLLPVLEITKMPEPSDVRD